MLAELRARPEALALTVERWAGGSSAEAWEEGAHEASSAFVVDTRLDPAMVRSAEEISGVLLTSDEGVLASRITESEPEKLEDALRRAATAADRAPALKFAFPCIMEDAERRLIMARRVNAALAVVPAGPAATAASSAADEKALVVLRKAMANAALDEAELQMAISNVSQASQAVRDSVAAQALVQRAKSLRSLWQWRRRCARVHRQLLEVLEDALQQEADERYGEGGPVDDAEDMLHDLEALSRVVALAQEYASEMEFDLLEAAQVRSRLERANVRFRAQRALQATACDVRQDKAALGAAIEAAVKVGASERVIAAGRARLAAWHSEHERAAHHDELFSALSELQRHLDSREEPGAGAVEQRRLRGALAGAGLPPEAPLAAEAALALKRWEAANGSLRAEARLRSAAQRAAAGFVPEEPQAGELLGSAIAEVSQRGVDARFLQEAREVLGRWVASRAKRAQRELSLALQYRDEEHLKQALALGREAGLEQEVLDEAARCLQRLRWEEEVSRLLEAAMESGDPELLEHGVQQAHDGCFLERDNCLLRSAALQFHLRFWASEIGASLQAEAVDGLAAQVRAADLRIAESQDALVALRRAEANVPEVAVRALERDARGLELLLPRARGLAAKHAAEKALGRVLLAVERHAAELPQAIMQGREQLSAGLDAALLQEAEGHLKAYESTVGTLAALVSKDEVDKVDLKVAVIKARLAGAPGELVSRALELLDLRCPETAQRARTELELHLALQEADDVGVLPAEGRFLRLQEAADEARRLRPPLGPELLEHVGQVSVALAAERTLVLAAAEARALLGGGRPASPEELLACAEALQRACTGAEQDAQQEALGGLDEALEHGCRLRREAEHRRALLQEVQKEVLARGSGAHELRLALCSARESCLPGKLLVEAYSKLRRRKLEGITFSLRAACEQRQPALSRGLWQRGLGLGAAEERSGGDWRSRKFQALENATQHGVLLRGTIAGERCGGSFGTPSWRRNPCYVVRQRPGPVVLAAGGGAAARLARVSTNALEPPKISVAVAEVGQQPANLSVHIVRNGREAAAAGCGSLLAPGFEVLACSRDEDELPHCSFELPMEEGEADRPVFIVPSAPRGEEGAFLLTVEGSVPVEVLEVPEALRWPWRFEQALELEWRTAGGRPSATMGGGRRTTAAPPLSWYRNPQFRIAAAPRGPPGAEPTAAPAAPAAPLAGPGPGPELEHTLSLELVAAGPAAASPAGGREGPAPSEEVLCGVFQRCDAAADGRINRRELVRSCRAHPEIADFLGLPHQIRQEDGSRDRMEDLFQSMDQDDDRGITWEEFRSYFARAPAGSEGHTASKARAPDIGVLLLAILTPEVEMDSPFCEPAALHILRNSEAAASTHCLAENPQLHKVLACSGLAGAEYSTASEVGAVCRLAPDAGGVLLVPSLETKTCEGKYTLRLLATEELVVERLV